MLTLAAPAMSPTHALAGRLLTEDRLMVIVCFRRRPRSLVIVIARNSRTQHTPRDVRRKVLVINRMDENSINSADSKPDQLRRRSVTPRGVCMPADMMYQPDLWEMYGQCCGTGRRPFGENRSISIADRLPRDGLENVWNRERNTVPCGHCVVSVCGESI